MSDAPAAVTMTPELIRAVASLVPPVWSAHWITGREPEVTAASFDFDTLESTLHVPRSMRVTCCEFWCDGVHLGGVALPGLVLFGGETLTAKWPGPVIIGDGDERAEVPLLVAALYAVWVKP